MQTRTDPPRPLGRDDLPGLVSSVVLVNALGAAPALLGAPNLEWFVRTPAFFALESLGLAFGIVVALWALVVATARAFARVDRRAAALLVPYLVWVTFAAVLNYAILAANG